MALPDYFELDKAEAVYTGIISKTIASGGQVKGREVDNFTRGAPYCALELIWQYSIAPTAGKTLQVHLVYIPVGTGSGSGAYEDDSIESLSMVVHPPADLSLRRRVKKWIPLLPFAFRPVVKNVDTGQDVTVTLRLYLLKDKVTE